MPSRQKSWFTTKLTWICCGYTHRHTHTHAYVCTYVCIFIYIYIYMYIYIYICIYIYIHIDIHRYTYIHTYVIMCIYFYSYAYLQMYIYIYTVRIYIYISLSLSLSSLPTESTELGWSIIGCFYHGGTHISCQGGTCASDNSIPSHSQPFPHSIYSSPSKTFRGYLVCLQI